MFFISKCKIKHFTKETFKILGISIFGCLIAAILVLLNFELRYNVKFLGQDLGYVKNKFEAEKLVTEYLNNTENIAYIEISEIPTYELKFVNKDEATDEKENVLDAVKTASTVYYKIYGITLENEIVGYTQTLGETEKVTEEITKSDKNLSLSVSEIVTEESKKLETPEAISSRIIENNNAKKLELAKAQRARNATSRSSAKRAATSTSEAPAEYVDIGNISFVRPTVGTVTSRFGRRGSSTHTGVDIATSKGTTIVASAGGTVTFTGWQGGYGNLVIVSHGSGVQTYYAHCNTISVTAGTEVSQGQKIAEVGSTGNSTGPHVHLEIRVNGSPTNPENYI